MKIDANNEFLLAGDTVGFISVFDIKDYCTSDLVHTERLPQEVTPEFFGAYCRKEGG